MNDDTLSLDDLAAATALPVRTLRYYIQIGLVDRPEGSGRGARYTRRHLDQALLVQALQRKGMTLEAIREFVARPVAQAVPEPRRPGEVGVWSHLYLRDGLELHVDASRAGLTPEQVRALFRAVMDLDERIRTEKP